MAVCATYPVNTGCKFSKEETSIEIYHKKDGSAFHQIISQIIYLNRKGYFFAVWIRSDMPFDLYGCSSY